MDQAATLVFRICVRGAGISFACSQNQDLLSAAVRAGIRLLTVGCRGGGCGICRVAVHEGSYTSGRMSKRHIPGDGGERRLALACRVYPSSDLVVELAPIERCFIS